MTCAVVFQLCHTIIDFGVVQSLQCFFQLSLSAREISAVVTVYLFGFPSAANKTLIRTDKGVCFQCVRDLNVHRPHGMACKQTSVTFHLTASLHDKEGTEIVHAYMGKWWICRSDSC